VRISYAVNWPQARRHAGAIAKWKYIFVGGFSDVNLLLRFPTEICTKILQKGSFALPYPLIQLIEYEKQQYNP
jgi:hypothetical protein